MVRKIEKDLLPFVTQIRHEFTNYDKLIPFYQYYGKQRTILNGIIFALIKGEIDIPTFKERVTEIENYVDLTKKRNQKRFLKTEQERLKNKALQPISEKDLKKFAKNNLSSILHGKCINREVSYKWKILDD